MGAKGVLWNRKFKEIAIHYFTSNFIVDFLSVVPFLFTKLAASYDNYRELLDRDYMQVFAYLRMLRITQLPKILGASTVYS